jgi:hypothetical protein
MYSTSYCYPAHYKLARILLEMRADANASESAEYAVTALKPVADNLFSPRERKIHHFYKARENE